MRSWLAICLWINADTFAERARLFAICTPDILSTVFFRPDAAATIFSRSVESPAAGSPYTTRTSLIIDNIGIEGILSMV